MPTTYRFKTQASETQFRFVAAAVLPIELEFEAPRNTDPGVSSVAKGTGYKIANADKVGTLALPFIIDPCYPADASDNEKALFTVGETTYFVATLTSWKLNLTGALVSLEVYDLDTWVEVTGSPLLDEVSVNFTGGVAKTLKTINGGGAYPSIALPAGSYMAYLTVAHADIPGGSQYWTAEFAVPDFPAAGNVLPNDTTNKVAGTAKVRVSVDAKLKAV